MTNIEYSCSDTKLWIKAQGHATGSVEVCSAVSALLIGLANYLSLWDEDAEIYIGDADVKIESSVSLQSAGAFNYCIVALRSIAEKYGEYIKIKEVNL